MGVNVQGAGDLRERWSAHRWLLVILFTTIGLLLIAGNAFELLRIFASQLSILPHVRLRSESTSSVRFRFQVNVHVNDTVAKRLISPTRGHLRPDESTATQVQARFTTSPKTDSAELKPIPKAAKPTVLAPLHFQKPLDSNIVVLTLSGRSKFATRQAIRKTWKRNQNNVFFVVGVRGCGIPPAYRREYECSFKTSPDAVPKKAQLEHERRLAIEQEKLQAEASAFNDMVLVDMVDSYRKLPRKLKLGYKWALQETTAEWILKADDDFFVRVARLGEVVKNRRPWRTVIGGIATGWVVPRKGKWAELNYKKSRYPSFPIGSYGHLVSRDVAQYVVTSDQFEFQGEDVSLGIWLDKKSDFTGVRFIRSPAFSGNQNCKDRSKLVVGHDFTPKKLEACQALGYL